MRFSGSSWASWSDVLGSAESDVWIDWLCERPLVEVARIGDHDFAMVHASSHPDWTLGELEARARAVSVELRGGSDAVTALLTNPDDPDRETLGRLTCCRNVTSAGEWSSRQAAPDFEPWHVAWSARAHGFGIVYGHWAMQGLHVAPWLRGLDTGCVHHGRGRDGLLTAWLPDPTSRRPFEVDETLWHEPARCAYYAHRDA